MQTQANRLALQAGADGCLVAPSVAALNSSVRGLGVSIVSVQALTNPAVNVGDDGAAAQLHPSDVFGSGTDANGVTTLNSNLRSAVCNASASDQVPAGGYVTVLVTYRQNLLFGHLFGHPVVQRTATTLSQNETEGLS